MTVPGYFKMCFALLFGSLILGYYGKVAIGTLWLCRLRMIMRVIINCRSVDIISYECGYIVSCWGSTSADMYSISTVHKMEHCGD